MVREYLAAVAARPPGERQPTAFEFTYNPNKLAAMRAVIGADVELHGPDDPCGGMLGSRHNVVVFVARAGRWVTIEVSHELLGDPTCWSRLKGQIERGLQEPNKP